MARMNSKGMVALHDEIIEVSDAFDDLRGVFEKAEQIYTHGSDNFILCANVTNDGQERVIKLQDDWFDAEK